MLQSRFYIRTENGQTPQASSTRKRAMASPERPSLGSPLSLLRALRAELSKDVMCELFVSIIEHFGCQCMMVFASAVVTTGQLSGRCERTKWSPSELDWVREPQQCFTNSEITKVFAMGQVDEPDIFGKGKNHPVTPQTLGV